MKIGIPKEIKPQENRIGLTPESVKVLVSDGHEVLVENNGGYEAGFYNEQYKSAGAKIIDSASDIFNDADIIVKVKEPLSNEVKMIREQKAAAQAQQMQMMQAMQEAKVAKDAAPMVRELQRGTE